MIDVIVAAEVRKRMVAMLKSEFAGIVKRVAGFCIGCKKMANGSICAGIKIERIKKMIKVRISIAAAAALEWHYLRNRKDGK